MIRKNNWKYIYYQGFNPELFDLDEDPEEINDLSEISNYTDVLKDLNSESFKICNPKEINKLAFKDQDDMIKRYGGIKAAKKSF